MNARFFIENKEVIGLWIIFAIAMWLGVCILDLIVDSVKHKIKIHRRRQIIVKRKEQEEIKKQNYIEKMQWQNEFHKQFQSIVNFEI